ncbi:GntR family transcriptional regulator [Desulfopila aestuarii]|nr:GntR family transcriptional regulator [Desulfopila aestuarii]
MEKKSRRPRPNLGEVAYDEIKAMILTGELKFGERLVLDELSERLNLSVTPIREALNKLAQDDLVVITPRTSHSVVQISAQDAADILDLRLLLETYALQTAGNRLATFPVSDFKHRFSEVTNSMDLKEFFIVDNAFHQAILSLSPNQRLPKLYSYLQNLIQVVSIQAIQSQNTDRIHEATEEHLELLGSIETGSVNAAVDCLQNHFEQMKSVVFRSAACERA